VLEVIKLQKVLKKLECIHKLVKIKIEIISNSNSNSSSNINIKKNIIMHIL